jgi:predicted NAD-dependent protein-ADP-ribosyltransferase YbiA (DUF1768 family)
MAKSTDLLHRCVVEATSKNYFKTFGNHHALRKYLLKTNKMVKMEEKAYSKLFCVL